MSRISKALSKLNNSVSSFKDLKLIPGDILLVEYDDKSSYITVVSLPTSSGFYYYTSDSNGKPINYSVQHSNMFLSDEMEIDKVKTLRFKQYKYQKHTYFETGIKEIDLQLNSLGDQYQMFISYAPKEVIDLYNKQEDKNKHKANQELVQSFLDHLISTKNPETFKVQEIDMSTEVQKAKKTLQKLLDQFKSTGHAFELLGSSDQLMVVDEFRSLLKELIK